MKQLLISIILILITFSAIGNQDSTQTEWKEKYFEYSIIRNNIIAVPLFSIPPHKHPDMIYANVEFCNKDYSIRDWTEFTIQFIEQVLKKHLTIKEIKQLNNEDIQWAKARLHFEFSHSGEILYTWFSWKKDVNHIFTDEKLYAIYQDFMKMKIDTEGFLWWLKGKKPTTEEQKKIYGSISIPFFFHKWP